MGRQQKAGLRKDIDTRQFYRRYDGRKVFFGPIDRPADAEARWHEFEARRAAVPDIKAALRSVIGIIQHKQEAVAKLESGFEILNALPVIDAERVQSASASFINGNLDQIADARMVFQELQAQLPATPDDSPAVKEVIDFYCEFCRVHRSQDQYCDAKNRLPEFLAFVGPETRIAQLSHERFIEYRNHVWAKINAGTWAPPSGNKYLVLVKAAFNRWLKDKGSLPAACISGRAALQTTGSGNTTDIPIITKDELDKILATASTKWQAITLTALNMAASNADIDDIKIAFINQKNRLLSFTREKNQRPRRIYLWKKTLALINQYREENGITGEHVFYSDTGGRFIRFTESKNGKISKNDYLSQGFGALMDKLGLPHSFRTLRKTASTVAKLKGADEETVEMLLGNADNKIWKRYVMPVPELLAATVKNVGQHFGIR